MSTTRADISDWLDEGNDGSNTHMIVVCDTFDYEDYPVYVPKGKSVRAVCNEYSCTKNMQRVMEVYSYRRSLKRQLAEDRSFHYD